MGQTTVGVYGSAFQHRYVISRLQPGASTIQRLFIRADSLNTTGAKTK